jgi:7-cyano-7-deazaguanine synthase in queuosine biosynthesis
MKIVILYSGGLDSFLMKKYAEKNYPNADVKCIYYAHGADSEEVEIDRLPEYVEIRTIDWLSPTGIRPVSKKSDPFASAIYIPGRNLVFAALAASQELPDEVWMGTLFDEDNEQATDKNEKFRAMTSEVLSYVLSPFINGCKVRFPFVEEKMSKVDTVKWAIETFGKAIIPELKETTSCWHNDGVPCGECKQCVKRFLVMKLNGIDEVYKVDPSTSKFANDLMDSYLKCENPNQDEQVMIDMISKYRYSIR